MKKILNKNYFQSSGIMQENNNRFNNIKQVIVEMKCKNMIRQTYQVLLFGNNIDYIMGIAENSSILTYVNNKALS